jgi:hypothetical protein
MSGVEGKSGHQTIEVRCPLVTRSATFDALERRCTISFDWRNGAHPSNDGVEVLLCHFAKKGLPCHRQLEHVAVAGELIGMPESPATNTRVRILRSKAWPIAQFQNQVREAASVSGLAEAIGQKPKPRVRRPGRSRNADSRAPWRRAHIRSSRRPAGPRRRLAS